MSRRRIQQSRSSPKYENESEAVLRLRMRQTALDSDTTSLKEIHTGYVKQAIINFQPIRVLNDHPPLGPLSVDRKEQKLDRKEQVRLAQLRSGFCSSLPAPHRSHRLPPM